MAALAPIRPFTGSVVPRPVRIIFRVLGVREYLAMTPVEA
jgi:hypothetical protein